MQRLRIERAPPRDDSPPRAGTPAIGHVLYSPARPTPEGRSLLVLSPLEFLAALARLIPPPRVHRHRYHGVLAPLRSRVTALASTAEPSGDPLPPNWARLLARIYDHRINYSLP